MNVKWARDCFEATHCSTGGAYTLDFLTEDEDRTASRPRTVDPTWTSSS